MHSPSVCTVQGQVECELLSRSFWMMSLPSVCLHLYVFFSEWCVTKLYVFKLLIYCLTRNCKIRFHYKMAKMSESRIVNCEMFPSVCDKTMLRRSGEFFQGLCLDQTKFPERRWNNDCSAHSVTLSHWLEIVSDHNVIDPSHRNTKEQRVKQRR